MEARQSAALNLKPVFLFPQFIVFAESGHVLPKEEFEKLFNNLDKDKSGTINYSEFVAAATNINVLLTEKRLESAFKFFDKDGSGSLEKEELMKAMSKGWISDVQLSDLFKSVDVNNDQKVS